MSVRAFLTALAFIGCATAALADRDDVRCVQAQLNAAGFDAGPVDGIPGRMTRRALNAFGEAHDMSTEFPLHRESAAPYCRRIGEAEPELRSFWPVSNAHHVEFDASDDVPRPIQLYLRTVFTSALRTAAQETGVDLSSINTLVVATGPRDLLRLFNAHAEYNLRDARETMRRHCNPEHEVGGGATPGIAFMCISGTFNIARRDDRMRLTSVAAHEAYHLVQYQLGGVLRANASERDRARVVGPEWFIEGSAQLFGYAVGYGLEERSVRMAFLRDYQNEDLPDLSTLERHSARDHASRGIYLGGAIAVGELFARGGWEGIGRVHTRIAEGMEFAEAFEAVYEQPLSEFYETYAENARPSARFANSAAGSKVLPD